MFNLFLLIGPNARKMHLCVLLSVCTESSYFIIRSMVQRMLPNQPSPNFCHIITVQIDKKF